MQRSSSPPQTHCSGTGLYVCAPVGYSRNYAHGTLTGTQTVLVVAMHMVHLQGHKQSVLVVVMHMVHLHGHRQSVLVVAIGTWYTYRDTDSFSRSYAHGTLTGTQSVLVVAMHVVHLQGHRQ